MATITTYSYQTSTLHLNFLSDAIKANAQITVTLQGIVSDGSDVLITFVDTLPAADKTALDTTVTAHDLRAAKVAKMAAIDSKTETLVSVGFVFSALLFALDDELRSFLNFLFQSRVTITYPVLVNSKNNLGKVTLGDAVAVTNFYSAGWGKYRSRYDSGTALKDQVRAANTVAEVDAVVDNRQ